MAAFRTMLTTAAVVFAAAFFASAPAHAALGGKLDTIEADRAHMRARATAAQTSTTQASASQAQASSYAAHTLTLDNGGTVKEYAGKDGTVFAVSWTAPGRPDLRQLLGPRFDDFQADNGVRRGARSRRALTTARPDLVVHSAGRPGAFYGFAYLPNLLPAGFSTADMQ